jgi:protease I
MEQQMTTQLNGIKVAILVADGFEQVEMTDPRKALDHAGAKTILVSPAQNKVQGWNHDVKGSSFVVDVHMEEANPEDYHALILPGGVMNPDALRLNPQAVAFVKHFVDAQKPIAAICHGPWTLINAKGVKGKTMTSWPSLQADLENAGATWVDHQVVVDNNLITSRNPGDLPAFNAAIAKLLAHAK